jgi:serine/threonine protein kinase
VKMSTQRAIATRSLTVAASVRSVPAPRNHDLRLPFGSLVKSAISGRQYRIGEVLGSGGFGAVYRITQVTGGKRLPGSCVLKVTLEVGAWHREAYFGELLRETPGIVRVHESFAWVPRGSNAKPLYCLVSEFVEGGDLIQYLQERREPWTESKARREIVRLLGPLRLLHAAGLVHRDITPRNDFVTAGHELKLGDFGIAAQRLGRQEAKANVFAPWFAPTAIKERKTSAWLPADDVYHLGKLFALLLHGGEKARLTLRECGPNAQGFGETADGRLCQAHSGAVPAGQACGFYRSPEDASKKGQPAGEAGRRHFANEGESHDGHTCGGRAVSALEGGEEGAEAA